MNDRYTMPVPSLDIPRVPEALHVCQGVEDVIHTQNVNTLSRL